MDPIRLLEQPDLSPRERAALEAGRTHAPVVYDVAGGAARLAHSLGAPASTVATTGALTLKLGVKVLAGVVLASAGLALWLRAEPAPAAQPVPKNAPAPSAEMAAPAPAAQPVPQNAPAPSSAAPVAPPPREPRAASAVVKPARSARKPHVARSTSPSATTTPELAPTPEPQAARESEPQAAHEPEPQAHEPEPQEKPVAAPSPSPAVLEMKAIARAKRALAEGEPGEALAILGSIARDFPRGYFIEERRALRVLALAESGESERARREASAFQRDFPSSSFTERVRKAAQD